ncbi:Hypothetical protein I595_1652 [Croceitalea dokdonensis DOKDO 023]|uniref:Uncharacterized protein n=1 Tax=Croceitalea dokdonensis DOKDO 023 TaxID=1300341 RepID=A0A0N8H402_9FLAO|nr:Hypothetical protein I595_1652 [Croceitalea dokdonensis DOKDO 023]
MYPIPLACNKRLTAFMGRLIQGFLASNQTKENVGFHQYYELKGTSFYY